MVKVLLLEDELYTRKFIKQIALESPLVSRVFDTSRSREAVDIVREHHPQIALMDIELGKEDSLNGLEAAKLIKDSFPDIEFIFITGYSKYAIDSFSVHPYDYILKPASISKVSQSISNLSRKICSKASQSVESNFERIIIKQKNELSFICQEDIFFIEKQSKNLFIHTKDSILICAQTLSEIESKLSNMFIRVHKSFIVNKQKIKKITDMGNRSFSIEFLDYDKTAYMSRYKFEELRSHFAPF